MFISKVRTVVIGLLLAAHCHAQSASPASGAAVTALPDRVRLSEILIETPQPYDSSPADTWDPKMWIAIGAAFGTLVTALTNLVRWWRERSFTHTIHEQSQQIVGLFQLLETLPAAPLAVDQGLAEDLAAKTRRALTELMQSLSVTLDRAAKFRMPPSGEMSFFRRWFLLFRPRTFRAGVAHFAFYSWLVPLLYTVCFFAVDQEEKPFLHLGMKLYIVLMFLVVALALRYWAIVEYRWLNPSHEKPGRLARALLWYTPVSFGELLARLYLLVATWNLVVDAYAQRYVVPEFLQDLARYLETRSSVAVTLITEVGFIGSVLICYFWARAEYRLHSHPTPKPSFPHNLRFLYSPRSAEGWYCQLAFYGILVLCAREAWLVPDSFRMVRQLIADIPAADIPDISSALLGASLSLIFMFAIHVVPPLYGAYRWGLAEFRERSYVQAPTQEPITEGSAPA
jgi:hypothetical protein